MATIIRVRPLARTLRRVLEIIGWGGTAANISGWRDLLSLLWQWFTCLAPQWKIYIVGPAVATAALATGAIRGGANMLAGAGWPWIASNAWWMGLIVSLGLLIVALRKFPPPTKAEPLVVEVVREQSGFSITRVDPANLQFVFQNHEGPRRVDVDARILSMECNGLAFGPEQSMDGVYAVPIVDRHNRRNRWVELHNKEAATVRLGTGIGGMYNAIGLWTFKESNDSANWIILEARYNRANPVRITLEVNFVVSNRVMGIATCILTAEDEHEMLTIDKFVQYDERGSPI